MSDVILTDEEVQKLTGYRQPSAQLAKLHALGFWRARRGRLDAMLPVYVGNTAATMAAVRTIAVLMFLAGLACFGTRATASIALPLIVGAMALYGLANRRARGHGEDGAIMIVLAAGALGAGAMIIEAVIQRL